VHVLLFGPLPRWFPWVVLAWGLILGLVLATVWWERHR
jgi:hypothetical protein